ncbi:hypothetical protein SteCoe_19551 [Stentor coeruleus]|uniref:EF-hand domain-containing protein n=1 Tax=Stentor coeruleus TaxID=5963 RepID=A0A1R2BU01_9CILI|nr:hypothetical protein SteCoe_19551 [Stentor coeruleus]
MNSVNYHPQRPSFQKSSTPISGKYKDIKLFPIKGAKIAKSVRNVSLSPLRISSPRKSSNDSIINPRAASDELGTLYTHQDPLFFKLNTLCFDSPIRTKSNQKNLPSLEKTRDFDEVIDALFIMNKCERGRIGAFSLTQLFVGLGFCEDCETVVEIFRNISEGQPLNMISYSKQELLKLCEDAKTDNALKSIYKDLKVKSTKEKIVSVQYLIEVIKKWWKKLDKSHSNHASFEDICKCYSDIGIIENSSDTKRIFLRINQFGNYKQFSSVFAKALLKHMISELTKVIKKGNEIGLPAEIAIRTQRRKVILKGLEGHSKVLDAIMESKLYNS